MSKSKESDNRKGKGSQTASRPVKAAVPKVSKSTGIPKHAAHAKGAPSEKRAQAAKKAEPIRRAKPARKAMAESAFHEPSEFNTRSAYEVVKEKSVRSFYQGERLNRESVIQVARAGIPKKEIHILINMGVGVSELSKIFNVSEKTVRNYQNEGSKLSSQQSEQLIKVKQLLDRGVEIFGSKEAFSRWLHKPAMGLDFEQPIELLVTSEGVNLVEDEVERIAYGDFS